MTSVTFGELLNETRDRGLTRVPPFLSVTLARLACRELEQPHDEGALDLDTLSLDFAGKVHVDTTSADAVLDLAEVLDALLAGHHDDELNRLLDDARAPANERSVADLRAFDQRLGHWLVKQTQPKKNVAAEFLAWLRPDEAPKAVSADFVQWIETERSTDVRAPSPRAAAPSPAGDSKRGLFVALGVLAVVIVGGFGFAIRMDAEPTPPPSGPIVLPPPKFVPPPPPQKVAAAPVIQPLAVPVEPTLPRSGSGIPARIVLSNLVHGIDVTTAGLELTAPSKTWAIKTVPAPHDQKPPHYAWLFVATLDEQGALGSLSLVGPNEWKKLEAPRARVFAMQPDQRPDDGTFALAVAVMGAKLFERKEMQHHNVLTETMTQVEGRRFMLEALEPEKAYVVRLKSGPAKVVVTATFPRAMARTMRNDGFQTKGQPIDQVLLQPGSQVTVKGVSRLSFVTLTSPGAPDAQAEVEVFDVIPISRGRGGR